jgi:hypothetical protein
MAPAEWLLPRARTKEVRSLIDQSVAQHTPAPIPEEVADRIERGRELYQERADEFRYEKGVWWIPSSDGTTVYGTRLGPIEVCECGDFEHRGARCKHLFASAIAQSKSALCACCGHRVLGRFLSEVQEEDELLSWFPGDRLCDDCRDAGFWS